MKSIDLLKPYFLEKRRVILSGVLCLVAVDFLQLCIPRIMKWTIDDLAAMRVDAPGLGRYALYLIAVAVVIGLLRYIWRNCLIGTSRRIEEGLRNRIFEHIQTLSASYFAHAKTGDLMARSTNDIQHVRMAVGMGVVALTDAIVLGAAAIGFMAYIDVRLTVFALIPMPLIALGAKFFSGKMHRRYQEVQKGFSDMTEVVRERFAGIRIIKAFAQEQAEVDNFKSISDHYVDKNLSLVRITGSFFPMMLLFSNLSLAVVLLVGGRQTIDLTITPGDFVAFIAYLGLLTWPMMAMGWVANLIQRGRASLDRINAILQEQPDIRDRPGIKPRGPINGDIVFERVTFFYTEGPTTMKSSPALSEIDIHLKKHHSLGIVGPPGSGKTTLISLIPRLFDATRGRILLDGSNLDSHRLRDLRDSISFVPQEPFLFSGSIRENITLGDNTISEACLLRAARNASLLDTIESFPKGLETIIGEKGGMLSGGQRQRIALARAFVRETPILILDDPISQVDLETGGRIINAIRTLAGGATLIIVSHRISAVRFADTIISLKNGRIIECGAHQDLVNNNAYYAKTFRLQEMEEQPRVH